MPKADKQEKEIARYTGGQFQSNSGGTKFGGGDVHTDKFFIEAKCHLKPQKTFSIPEDWLKKAREQAFEQGKDCWALAIRYSEDGSDYFVISKREFIEYLEWKESVEDGYESGE